MSGHEDGIVEVPAHVSPKMRRWIKETLSGWDFQPEDVMVAVAGAEAWDQAAAARKILAARGLTYKDRLGNPRLRPEAAVARDSKIAFLRAVRLLKESMTAWLKTEAKAAEAEAEAAAPKRPYLNRRRTPEWVTELRRKEEAES